MRRRRTPKGREQRANNWAALPPIHSQAQLFALCPFIKLSRRARVVKLHYSFFIIHFSFFIFHTSAMS